MNYGLLIVFWIVINTFVGGVIGSSRNNISGGVIWGALLGPIGWILILFLDRRAKCPECRGPLLEGAQRCQNCGLKLDIPKSATEIVYLSRHTVSFAVSLALASIFNALLVVIKEKSPALQTAMKSLTGHHWITHVLVTLALFLVSGWIFSRLNLRLTTGKLIATLVSGVALGGLIILGFYLIAD